MPNPEEESGVMKGFIMDICDECGDMLREPDRSQSKAAVKIVCSLLQTARKPCIFFYGLSSCSPIALVAQHVLSQNLPPLLTLYHSTPSSKHAVLSCLAEFLNASHLAEMERKKQETISEAIHQERAIDAYKDQILGALVVGLKSNDTQKSSINAYSNALHLERFLTAEELGFTVHLINEVIFGTDDSKEDVDNIAWFALFTPESLLF
jgi:DNA repair/transcription protein MET18/MMS19